MRASWTFLTCGSLTFGWPPPPSTTGAGHDFDEGIIFKGVVLDEVVDEGAGVAQAADGSDVKDEVAEDDRCLLDALQAANAVQRG